MRDTSLSQADPFVKMSITSILSGLASKASGGDFVQGAMSAMVVWLYNDFMDGIAERVAFGNRDKLQTPSWFSKLFTNIKNTNKQRKFGAIGLVQADDGTISMVEAKLETSKKNFLGVGIGGSIGKAKAKILSIDGNHKSFTVANIGFNTFSGELNGRIGHIKLGFVGYAGGVSGKLEIGKKGALGLSLGLGLGFKWDWIDNE